jgi:hypothetical protein
MCNKLNKSRVVISILYQNQVLHTRDTSEQDKTTKKNKDFFLLFVNLF